MIWRIRGRRPGGLPLPVIGTALREQLATEAKQDEWRGQNL